jgi:hypothetical protein
MKSLRAAMIALGLLVTILATPSAASAEPQDTTVCAGWRVEGRAEARSCLTRESTSMSGYVEVHNLDSVTTSYAAWRFVGSTSGGTLDCGVQNLFNVASGAYRRTTGCFVSRHAGYIYHARGYLWYNGAYRDLGITPPLTG